MRRFITKAFGLILAIGCGVAAGVIAVPDAYAESSLSFETNLNKNDAATLNAIAPTAGAGTEATAQAVEDLAVEIEGDLGVTEKKKGPGLPQLDLSTYPSQIFWLTICFVILYVVMRRHSLPMATEAIHKRERYIAGNLEAAREMREKAEMLKVEYEHLLTQADSNARKFFNDSMAEVAQDKKIKLQEIAAHIAERIETAESNVSKQKEGVMASVEGVARKLAQTIFDEVILADISGESKKTKKRA